MTPVETTGVVSTDSSSGTDGISTETSSVGGIGISGLGVGRVGGEATVGEETVREMDIGMDGESSPEERSSGTSSGKNILSSLFALRESDKKESDIVDTYDFITVQLYEGYSHTQYKTQILKLPPHTVITDLVKSFIAGWVVDFDCDKSVDFPTQRVTVPSSRLVIGLANGWAGDGKFLLIQPDQVRVD